MMWRKKKRKDITLSDITSRIRGFILDSQVTDADHISVLLGCSVISDEIADKEEEESDYRVARVEHLIPVMYAYAHAMAEGVVEHQRDHIDEEDIAGIPTEAWLATRKAFTQIAMNSLLGAISQLVDMGFLDTPKRKGNFK